jgi:hypothetical protein
LALCIPVISRTPIVAGVRRSGRRRLLLRWRVVHDAGDARTDHQTASHHDLPWPLKAAEYHEEQRNDLHSHQNDQSKFSLVHGVNGPLDLLKLLTD